MTTKVVSNFNTKKEDFDFIAFQCIGSADEGWSSSASRTKADDSPAGKAIGTNN